MTTIICRLRLLATSVVAVTTVLSIAAAGVLATSPSTTVAVTAG